MTLDKTRHVATLPGPQGKRAELVVIEATHRDRVDLDADEAGARSRIEPGEHPGERTPARDRCEAIRTQAVEADGQARQARRTQRARQLLQARAVGRHHHLQLAAGALDVRKVSHEIDQTLTDRRLATRQSHALDAPTRQRLAPTPRAPRASEVRYVDGARCRPPACSRCSGSCSGRSTKSRRYLTRRACGSTSSLVASDTRTGPGVLDRVRLSWTRVMAARTGPGARTLPKVSFAVARAASLPWAPGLAPLAVRQNTTSCPTTTRLRRMTRQG
jgi:hypothetical protein